MNVCMTVHAVTDSVTVHTVTASATATVTVYAVKVLL